MLLQISVGFFQVRIWDVFDILIVAYLLYQLYHLLRGSVAFNIILGIITLSIIWWLVTQLHMDLLSELLSQFFKVGFIIFIVIFQPEIRRFLVLVGNNALRQRFNFLGKWLERDMGNGDTRKHNVQAVGDALLRMSQTKTGALVLLGKDIEAPDTIGHSGVVLNAEISPALIESIFNKESPLHDGAMIISNDKILAASVVLPVSDNTRLPAAAGLRHRAAVGVTERSNVVAFVVSEETGRISVAVEGQLKWRIAEEQVRQLLEQHYR